MKKILSIHSAIMILGFSLFLPLTVHAQATNNFWSYLSGYLKPVLSSWGLQIPSLVSCSSIITDANGKLSCGSGGGVGTSTNPFMATYFVATSTTATSTFAGGLSVAGTSGLTVLQNGNVGIGTTSPGQKLSVAGDILGNNIIGSYFTGTSTTVSTFAGPINTSGTTGGYRIDNNLILQASSTNYSTLVGKSAGVALLSDGLYNTALGFEALKVATSSDYNTAVGYRSLYSNTTGSNNTAQGMYSLRFNTTGNYNTAQGMYSLYSNTTGNYNVANGAYSLYSNTTGAGNTASGYYSLNVNTSGNYNTAQGMHSLRSNTTGSNNTANGMYSLSSNTTGAGNTVSGYFALNSSITGNYNIALGQEALQYNTSATSSVAIGYQAGRGVAGTSNQNNSLFGYQSGLGLSTGSNNLLLGYKSGDALTTGSNNIIIGYDIDALAVDSTNFLNIGNTIYGNTSTGNVGIGTTSPYAKLSVTNTGTGPSFVVEDSTSPDSTPFIVDASGNVGIGTTAPTSKLQIVSAYEDTLGNENADIGFGSDGTNPLWGFQVGAAANYPLMLNREYSSTAYNVMTWDRTNGNVGIGTTSPAYRLDVRATGNVGETAIALFGQNHTTTGAFYGGLKLSQYVAAGFAEPTGFRFAYVNESNVSTDMLTFSKTGNVGVGTTSPYAKLSVAGQTVSEYFTATSTTATSTFNGAIRMTKQYTPPASSSTCTIGDFVWDADYFYICTATNVWERSAHATW